MINKFSKLTESTSAKFKIGLDLHGVIDALPEFFAFLTDSVSFENFVIMNYILS